MKRLNLQPLTLITDKYKRILEHIEALPELEIRKFVFDLPLYQTVKFTNPTTIKGLMGCWSASVDGYCFDCGRETVFHTIAGEQSNLSATNMPSVFFIMLQCQRANHLLSIAVNFQGVSYPNPNTRIENWAGQIEKIGQTPSHADISIGELGRYKGVLNGIDRSEFVRAIGLAANGVHIGAFLYLRRLFERLVERAKQRAGDCVDHQSFTTARMAEKINLLKDFLPEFLVSNSKIYSVLSKGVHELDEETCGSYFPIMRESCLLMLEQERELKEKADLERSLAQAIAAIE